MFGQKWISAQSETGGPSPNRISGEDYPAAPSSVETTNDKTMTDTNYTDQDGAFVAGAVLLAAVFVAGAIVGYLAALLFR
jgi:hypothetical protein